MKNEYQFEYSYGSVEHGVDVLLHNYNGISGDSKTIAEIIRGIIESDPVNLGFGVAGRSEAWKTAYLDIQSILNDCAHDNWDGFGASRIMRKTVKLTKKFLEIMPNYLLPPEVSAEPDGHINLEWYTDRNHVFEISIDKDGYLYYAGRLFGEKFSGTEMLGDVFPDKLESNIRNFS